MRIPLSTDLVLRLINLIAISLSFFDQTAKVAVSFPFSPPPTPSIAFYSTSYPNWSLPRRLAEPVLILACYLWSILQKGNCRSRASAKAALPRGDTGLLVICRDTARSPRLIAREGPSGLRRDNDHAVHRNSMIGSMTGMIGLSQTRVGLGKDVSPSQHRVSVSHTTTTCAAVWLLVRCNETCELLERDRMKQPGT